LSFFMQDVQTLVSFKIHPVHDREIHLRSFEVSQPDSDAELGDGPHSVGKDLLVRPAGRPCEVQKLFYPRTPRPERGVTGCPPGNVRLDIALEYETQDMRYRLKGPHLVTVLPNNADPQAIQTYIGDRIEQTTGSGPTSGGAHYKEYHVQVSGVDTARKAEEFVRKMQDEFGLVYKPVLLHLSEVVTPPDWPPMTKARLSFVHEGVPQNYCLLPQKSIVFGRSASHVDMRLFEVERCNANMRRQEREGVPKHKRSSESQVGRVQWRVEPTPESVRVASLRMTEAMTIQEGEIRLLKRNEQVTLREVIGLKYVGDANALEELDECRKSAREILSKMKHPPRRREDWTGPLGGYCLARLFSLTGKPVLGVEGAENLLAAEYYVLIPGWITLGASKDEACIQIPGKDMAAVHAAILFVDGYYFLVGLTHRDDVAVDGKPMPSHTPWPLKPGAKIQLGATTIQFAEFSQLFI